METEARSIVYNSSVALAHLFCDSFRPGIVGNFWECMNSSVYQYRLWLTYRFLFHVKFLISCHYPSLQMLNIFIYGCSFWEAQNNLQDTLSFLQENVVWIFIDLMRFQHLVIQRWKLSLHLNIWPANHLPFTQLFTLE